MNRGMFGRTFAMVTALAGLALGAREATAAADLQVVEPADGQLDFGSVEVFATSAPRRITIRNVGDDIPYFTDVWIGPPFQIVAEGGSLAPGGSYSWDVVVTPGSDELWGCSGSFELDWSDAAWDGNDHHMYVSLGCTAVPGPYAAEEAAFGTVAQGASRTLTVPVTNTGATPRQITALAMGGGPFSVQLHGGSLPLTVAPGGTFELELVFAPTTQSNYLTHVAIVDGDGVHFGLRVFASGSAVKIAVAPGALAFGDTYRHPSVPPAADVLIANVGTVAATLPAAAIVGPGFGIASGPPPGVLPPQGSVTYRVAFAPPAVGTFAARLDLGQLGEVPLSGRGVLRPVSTVASLDFGAVEIGGAVRRTISLHNAGPVAITVSYIEADDGRFRVMSGDRTIPPSGDLIVELEYSPSGPSTDLAALAIALDGDPLPQLSVALRGEACDPEVTRCGD